FARRRPKFATHPLRLPPPLLERALTKTLWSALTARPRGTLGGCAPALATPSHCALPLQTSACASPSPAYSLWLPSPYRPLSGTAHTGHPLSASHSRSTTCGSLLQVIPFPGSPPRFLLW